MTPDRRHQLALLSLHLAITNRPVEAEIIRATLRPCNNKPMVHPHPNPNTKERDDGFHQKPTNT